MRRAGSPAPPAGGERENPYRPPEAALDLPPQRFSPPSVRARRGRWLAVAWLGTTGLAGILHPYQLHRVLVRIGAEQELLRSFMVAQWLPEVFQGASCVLAAVLIAHGRRAGFIVAAATFALAVALDLSRLAFGEPVLEDLIAFASYPPTLLALALARAGTGRARERS